MRGSNQIECRPSNWKSTVMMELTPITSSCLIPHYISTIFNYFDEPLWLMPAASRCPIVSHTYPHASPQGPLFSSQLVHRSWWVWHRPPCHLQGSACGCQAAERGCRSGGSDSCLAGTKRPLPQVRCLQPGLRLLKVRDLDPKPTIVHLKSFLLQDRRQI